MDNDIHILITITITTRSTKIFQTSINKDPSLSLARQESFSILRGIRVTRRLSLDFRAASYLKEGNRLDKKERERERQSRRLARPNFLAAEYGRGPARLVFHRSLSRGHARLYAVHAACTRDFARPRAIRLAANPHFHSARRGIRFHCHRRRVETRMYAYAHLRFDALEHKIRGVQG